MAVTARVAVVTAAATGIGAAVAIRLAADGMAVGVLGFDEVACKLTASAIVDRGGRAAAIGVDVDDQHSVKTAVSRTVVALGAPSILVNTTGPVPDRGFLETTPEDWDKVIGLYLRGAYNLTRTMHRHLVEAGDGRIVMVAPEPAPGRAGHSAYAMARAGLFGLTRALAVELGPIGTTVNAVKPSCIMADTDPGLDAGPTVNVGLTVDAGPTVDAGLTVDAGPTVNAELAPHVALGLARHGCARALPLGRTGSAADVANAVGYLVGTGAAFVTGQILQVSGGHCC